VNTLSAGLSWIDLQFLGRSHAIGAGVAGSPGALALIDPGPTTCLATLDLGLQQQGLRMADVTDVLLTHIHLDHAGVTGTDEERSGRFVERIRLEMRRRMPESQVDAYFSTSPFHLLWLGLARYWRKRIARLPGRFE
jgi:glyoxylase-like metal-dependent hydrolase (beta-lactamase superfamily II)